jgi:hypothetical protein
LIIARAGFSLAASSRPTEDLKRIATAAASSRVTITLRGLSHLSIADLVASASAGEGAIRFEE